MRKYIILFSLLYLHQTISFALLSGSYTVGGSNPDFSTLAQAVTALQSGISSSVTFNLRSGIYNETLSIPANIPGTSASKIVTFQSESLNSSDVTIQTQNNYALSVGACRITFKNLSFKGNCHMSYCDDVIFKNIIFLNDSNNYFSVAFCNYCKFLNNKFYTKFDLANGGTNTVANNFFYGSSFRNSYSDHSVMILNSFAPESYFRNCSSYSLVENNIMPVTFINDILTSVVRFNDYPFGFVYYLDNYAYTIDPKYISQTDLHATNTQLIARANLSGTNYDIDNNFRPNPPTIGANEICISADTLNIYCGDSITLSFCNLPFTGNFVWTPSYGLNDSNLARPKTGTQISQWYHVSDSISGFKDSVYINVINFIVKAKVTDSIKFCGYGVMLSANYNEAATYQWYPTDSLNTPNNYYTNANPTVTTNYIVISSINGCGISSDTISVLVNPIPYAFTYLDTSTFHNKICFYNISSCADNYYWDFGDSTYSINKNPCHIYANTGYFLVKLKACNSYGCSTFQGYVIVDTIYFNFISEIIDKNNSINIIPNPSKNVFTLITDNINNSEMEIYNLNGNLVFRTQLNKEKEHLINTNLSKGFYLIKINSKGKIYSKKLIIE